MYVPEARRSGETDGGQPIKTIGQHRLFASS